MSWKAVFEGIQSFTEDVLLTPYNALRTMELDNWWAANLVSWVLMAIGFVAFIYWMGELKKYDAKDEDDKSSTAHSFLG